MCSVGFLRAVCACLYVSLSFRVEPQRRLLIGCVCYVSRVYGGGYVLSDTVQDGACCCESKENSVVCSSYMVRGRSDVEVMPRCRKKACVNQPRPRNLLVTGYFAQCDNVFIISYNL